MEDKKLVYGIGINDSDYVVKKWETIGCVNGKRKRKQVWICPFYKAWKSMLVRCYSSKHQERHPTYKGCSVSEDWLTFSNFKRWMEAQDWEGKHLDKDLLFEGNKVYSEETCVFVSSLTNTFVNESNSARGNLPIGVSWFDRDSKYRVNISNPFTKKREHIGYFHCPQEAHQAWLKRKLELAHLLAAEQTDQRVAKALISRYENYNSGDGNG